MAWFNQFATIDISGLGGGWNGNGLMSFTPNRVLLTGRTVSGWSWILFDVTLDVSASILDAGDISEGGAVHDVMWYGMDAEHILVIYRVDLTIFARVARLESNNTVTWGASITLTTGTSTNYAYPRGIARFDATRAYLGYNGESDGTWGSLVTRSGVTLSSTAPQTIPDRKSAKFSTMFGLVGENTILCSTGELIRLGVIDWTTGAVSWGNEITISHYNAGWPSELFYAGGKGLAVAYVTWWETGEAYEGVLEVASDGSISYAAGYDIWLDANLYPYTDNIWTLPMGQSPGLATPGNPCSKGCGVFPYWSYTNDREEYYGMIGDASSFHRELIAAAPDGDWSDYVGSTNMDQHRALFVWQPTTDNLLRFVRYGEGPAVRRAPTVFAGH